MKCVLEEFRTYLINMSRSNTIFSILVLGDLAEIGFGMLPFHFRSPVESIFGNNYILLEARLDFPFSLFGFKRMVLLAKGNVLMLQFSK